MNEAHIGSRHDLYSRPSIPKIFISSEMRSGVLQLERRVAAQAVESSERAKAWYWERDALAGPYSSESICLGQARTSDGLVLLVADRITQIVRDEYFAAHDAGAPCFVFIKTQMDRDTEARQFIDEIREHGHVTINFESLEQLSKSVTSAIEHHFTWSWREHQLHTRFQRASTSSVLNTFTSLGSESTKGSRPYDSIPISIGYEVVSTVSLSETVERARASLDIGHYRGAIDQILDAAAQAGAYGFSDTVEELIDFLLTSVPPQAFERRDQAWLLNFEGLALSHQGHISDAVAKFQLMQKLGEDLGDHEIKSIALQNLAIQAHLNGNYDQAKELNKQALRQRHEIQDYRGVFQVFINQISLLLEMGDLDFAGNLISDLEPVLAETMDIHLLCTFVGNKGLLAVKRQDFVAAESMFKESLAYARESGDRLAIVHSLRNLGNVNFEMGRCFRALLWYRRALIAAETMGNFPELQATHASLAVILLQAKRLPEAEIHLSTARTIAAQRGDRSGLAALNADAGVLAFLQGDHERAINQLNNARSELQELGNRDREIWVLRNLAEVHLTSGDETQADVSTEQALQLISVEDHANRVPIMRRAAYASLEVRKSERARNYFQRSLIEERLSSEDADIAWSNAAAAVALAGSGSLAMALPFFSNSLDIFQRLGDWEAEYGVRIERANAQTVASLFVDARMDYDECIRIAGEMGDWSRVIQALSNQGEMERRSGDFTHAHELLRQAVKLAREHQDAGAEAKALGNLGIVLANLGSWDEARETFESAQSIARNLDDTRTEAVAVGGLASVQFNARDYASAAQLYRQASELNRAIEDYGHFLEDLAGLVESLAAMGDVETMEVEGQRLIDSAQDAGVIQIAVQSLVSSAQSLMRLQLIEDAIGVFAAAIVGAFVDLSDEQDDGAVSWPIYAMVNSFNQMLPSQAESLYDKVVDQISTQQGLTREDLESLREYIREVHVVYLSMAEEESKAQFRTDDA